MRGIYVIACGIIVLSSFSGFCLDGVSVLLCDPPFGVGPANFEAQNSWAWVCQFQVLMVCNLAALSSSADLPLSSSYSLKNGSPALLLWLWDLGW